MAKEPTRHAMKKDTKVPTLEHRFGTTRCGREVVYSLLHKPGTFIWRHSKKRVLIEENASKATCGVCRT